MKKAILPAFILLVTAGIQAVPIATGNTERMRVDPTPFQAPESEFERTHWAGLGMPATATLQAPVRPEASTQNAAQAAQRLRPSFGG